MLLRSFVIGKGLALAKQSNSRERYLERASRQYHLTFVNPKNANESAVINGRKYLTDHGIGLMSIAKTYHLGVVINPLPGDERFTGWLSIPYDTPRGFKGIRFRNLSGNEPKIGQHPGQPGRLYNTKAYFADSSVIGIAEGEIDAIAATECLGLPTIAVPGSQMWAAHKNIWSPLFKNFRQVLVLRDGDQAGKDLADQISESLKLRARVIDMPAGEDVSSMVAKGRAEELTKQFDLGDDE